MTTAGLLREAAERLSSAPEHHKHQNDDELARRLRAAADRAPEGRDAVLEEAINAACQCLAVDQDMANFGNAMIRQIRALKSSAKETG